MLVLTRKEEQSVVFPSCGILVHVLSVKGRTIKLGIEAPKDIEVLRGELLEDSTHPAPAFSENLPIEKVAAPSMLEQFHDLRSRLSTLTTSLQTYNNLKSIGQAEAASKTLECLLVELAKIESDWNRSNTLSLSKDPGTMQAM